MLDFPKGLNASATGNCVEYNVAGLYLCTDLIFQMIEMVQDKFDYTLPIKYIYGSPQVRWNGGRTLLKKDINFSEQVVENEVKKVVSKGIVPLFTFSNSEISEMDLEDKQCNLVLNIINEYDAEVIVTSELLEKYIREKYPDIKIHASVIKTAFESIRNVEYYNSLAQKYENYVIHPDDNFNYKLLALIKKKNAEIILNERCNYRCRLRSKHYESISREQVMVAKNKYQNERFIDKCSAIPEHKQISTKVRNVSLTVSEMKAISQLGFRLFKIQGRTDNLYVYFFDLMRYMLEGEIVFPTAYTIFSEYIDKFIRKEK